VPKGNPNVGRDGGGLLDRLSLLVRKLRQGLRWGAQGDGGGEKKWKKRHKLS